MLLHEGNKHISDPILLAHFTYQRQKEINV
jgi:hypothetical protein